MKKAKEYAKIFNDNPTVDTLIEIVVEFVHEIPEIGEKRHAYSNEAFLAILNEQEKKWQALCRSCPAIPPMAFEETIKAETPEVYRLWKGDK